MESGMSVKRPSLVARLVLGVLLTASASRADEPTKQECIAANESAQALRQAGKLRDARSKLSVCIASSCPGPVREDCAQRLEDVQKAIPTVVFDVKDTAGRDLLDVKLSVDGSAQGSVRATGVPLDPGPHTFRFEAAGAPAADKSVVVREGERERRITVVIGNSVAPPPAVPPGLLDNRGAEATPTAQSGEAQPAPGAGDTQRLAGWITGGAGVVAMGVGVVVGLVAKSSYEGAAGCSGAQCTSQTGLNTSNSAIGTGNAATGVFVVGAVATAAGVVLWLTAPKPTSTGDARATLHVGLTVGGALAQGTF